MRHALSFLIFGAAGLLAVSSLPAAAGTHQSVHHSAGSKHRRPSASNRVDGAASRESHKPSGKTYTGKASFYGGKWHGHKTANGEIYNQNSMTAAHRTLPFNSRVRVTNLKNGRSVVLRINNRGPFVGGRIIDVSFAAAKKLGMVGSGVVPAKVDVL